MKVDDLLVDSSSRAVGGRARRRGCMDSFGSSGPPGIWQGNLTMRSFHVSLALLVVACGGATDRAAETKSFDVVVYGATPAGVFAAVAAQREGATVALVEPMDIVGGVVSSG